MPRGSSTNKPVVQVPARSANALRAYAAGSVTSTIDLTGYPVRRTVAEQATHVVTRNVVLLGMAASLVWVYDLARIVAS